MTCILRPETGDFIRIGDLFNHIMRFMHKRALLSVQMSLGLLFPLFYSLCDFRSTSRLYDSISPSLRLTRVKGSLHALYILMRRHATAHPLMLQVPRNPADPVVPDAVPLGCPALQHILEVRQGMQRRAVGH